MDGTALFEEIGQGALRNVYLLHGEEEYAKDRAVDALLESTEESLRDFNTAVLENPPVDEIIAACEQLPLMDERRMVFVRQSRLFAGEGEGEGKKLLAYLPRINPSSCLVFVERGICDGRKSLFKALQKMGAEVRFDFYGEEEAAKWACSFARRQGGKLGADQARRLVMMTGRKLMDVAAETSKLCDYAAGQVITDAMLELCVHRNLEYQVFEMLEHLLAGRMRQAFAQLKIARQENGTGGSIMVLSFIAGRLRLMLTARYALDGGKNPAAAAKLLEGSPYAAKKAVASAQKFTTRELEDAMGILAEADYSIKSGKMQEDLALESALAKIFARSARA